VAAREAQGRCQTRRLCCSKNRGFSQISPEENKEAPTQEVTRLMLLPPPAWCHSGALSRGGRPCFAIGERELKGEVSAPSARACWAPKNARFFWQTALCRDPAARSSDGCKSTTNRMLAKRLVVCEESLWALI